MSHSQPSCIFCQIIAGKIPCAKLYEDSKYLAFLDIQPLTRGHALVVPKHHSSDLLHARTEDRKGLLEVVTKIAPVILKTVGASAFNLGINTGKDSGQVIFHTHAHIIPRTPADGLKSWGHSGPARAHTENLPELATKIARGL